MRLSISLILSLPFGGLAGRSYEDSSRFHHTRRAQSLQARNNTKVYKLQDHYEGASFFSDWNFFSGPDPTHGSVNYLNEIDATTRGLAYVQGDGATVLAVDDYSQVAVGGNRNSVRISSKKKYNSGLFIADFAAMPHGCSVWPAYWSVAADNWPNGGEIDILEGVHEQKVNQYTLHTSAGCKLTTENKTVAGNVIHDECASSPSDNRGCGFLDTDTRSYGIGFNTVGGGVFAHLWNNDGISIWHFARPEIPGDISARKPDPTKWGTPVATWSSKSCDMPSHFYDHSLVIDTTLCGDWAGASYQSAGCSGTCAQAVADPNNFKYAKWKVNSILVYQ